MHTNIDKSKACSKCGVIKDLELFCLHQGCKDGRAGYCKDCKKTSDKTYNAANRESIIAKKNLYRAVNRDIITARRRAHSQRPEVNAKRRADRQKPEVKAHEAAYRAVYRENNRDELNRKLREYQKKPDVKARALDYMAANRLMYRKAAADHAAKNPEKIKARNDMSRAIRYGKLIRQPCETCGNPKTDGHHDDYSKPLSVRWLCRIHHKEHHRLENDAAKIRSKPNKKRQWTK